MAEEINIEALKKIKEEGQYERRIAALQAKQPPMHTKCIEDAVTKAAENLKGNNRSFVIYGDPQSGKTEMMIALTAKLLDEGYQIIIHLVTDNVLLLNQNLKRFKESGINPSAKNFDEILDNSVTIEGRKWVIFSKKNPKDLEKVLAKLGKFKNKLIIDDEADYATPNSKIKLKERSTINKLINKLKGSEGVYIGVTATPARLDLNNTLQNRNDKWVYFPPHPKYTGPDTFFPLGSENLPYKLTPLLNDSEDNLRDAFLRFCINVAYLNLFKNDAEKNYCMLIHTSGKVDDHTRDYQAILKFIDILSDRDNSSFGDYCLKIFAKANEMYPGKGKEIIEYVVQKISKHQVTTMNSKKDISKNKEGNTPIVPFTVVVGGNIISRGVTFDNLLSMFFTRNVKGVFHADTYIQRARMFGSRGEYLDTFELIIPEDLYRDWHKCFVFHRLSLEPIKAGGIPPVWAHGARILPTARGSIDRDTVIVDAGEMKFEIFTYSSHRIEQIVASGKPAIEMLKELKTALGNAFPQFILDYVLKAVGNDNELIALYGPMDVSGWRDVNQRLLIRPRNFIALNAGVKKRFPRAEHHIQVVYSRNKARLIYKPMVDIGFIRNVRGR
jgi:transcriptional/translational regulatory protein YebC/TACO1